VIRISALVSVLVVLLSASLAAAQVPGVSAFASAQCSGQTVIITVDLTRTGAIPSTYLGWVVTREVVGSCVPDETFSAVLPFPVTGFQQYTIIDNPTVAGRNTIYRLHGIDQAGNLDFILWPQRSMFAQADCVGGPAARGIVTEVVPGQYYLDVCIDQCWWVMSSIDPHLPPEAPQLVGQEIDVFGQLFSGMEGPFIQVTGWALATEPCEPPVPINASSWSDVKARFGP
jgi:hypothetical protein